MLQISLAPVFDLESPLGSTRIFASKRAGVDPCRPIGDHDIVQWVLESISRSTCMTLKGRVLSGHLRPATCPSLREAWFLGYIFYLPFCHTLSSSPDQPTRQPCGMSIREHAILHICTQKGKLLCSLILSYYYYKYLYILIIKRDIHNVVFTE